LCTKPIHKAQPEVMAKARPAKRIPQAPSPKLLSFNNNHGAKPKLRLLPKAKQAMVSAPSKALPVSAATIKAEYNKPQGMKAHKPPTAKGATLPKLALKWRILAQSCWAL
jgi:hypothetical protein